MNTYLSIYIIAIQVQHNCKQACAYGRLLLDKDFETGGMYYHFCLYIFPQDEVVDVQLELGDESGPKDYFHGEYK